MTKDLHQELANAVRSSLCKSPQKQLPYSCLYDDIGSALFEVITLLPEYGVSRAEIRLLEQHSQSIAGHFQGRVSVAELGSGTGTKTRFILESLSSRRPVHYYPIDISSRALDQCEQDLKSLSRISIVKFNLPYLQGLGEVISRRRADETLLLLFLGSTIGNLDPGEVNSLLTNIRQLLKKNDAFLLGADLQKETSRMLLAYDDPLGVTAAFNLNLLAHLNRALGADFNLDSFAHEARYNLRENRIEMHLRSLKEQTVTISMADLRISLDKNETIWTEVSYKYNPGQLVDMAQRFGFEPAAQWIDSEWPFALNLWIVP